MEKREVNESAAQNDVIFEAHENAPFGIETEPENAPVMLSPVQIQQEYYENLPDCDWVKYELKNRNFLLQNVAFALFGSPSSEGELSDIIEGQVRLEGYTIWEEQKVMKVYEKLCEQSKYSQTDEDVMLSVLLVVCARPKPLKFYQLTPSNYWLDLHLRTDIDIWCTAVFRVRKSIPTTVGAKTSNVFIDEDARVYLDWESYLLTNTQPKCVLIVPENGEYKGTIIEGGNQAFMVKLTVAPSPALGAKTIVLSHQHSLGSWLIAALTVGLAVIDGPYLLARSVAASIYMPKMRQSVSVEVLRQQRHANLMVTGRAGVVNNLVHIILKYLHGEQPTKLELFQFTTATLFFCHAVMSNKTAQSIIEDAQTRTIYEYRTTLRSNRHRKIFDKLSAESQRVSGTVQGNTEVIHGIQNIDNKDQYFASILNKDLNTY